jgi:hypothetical protein
MWLIGLGHVGILSNYARQDIMMAPLSMYNITTCPIFVIAKNRFPFITLCNVGKCYDGDKYVY